MEFPNVQSADQPPQYYEKRVGPSCKQIAITALALIFLTASTLTFLACQGLNVGALNVLSDLTYIGAVAFSIASAVSIIMIVARCKTISFKKPAV